jgi:hypothetical protein
MKFFARLSPFFLAAALLLPAAGALGQCAGGPCARPAYGYSFPPAPAYGAYLPVEDRRCAAAVAASYAVGQTAPLYRQYGGSGVVYSFYDPIAMNAWLAVHDPARPAAPARPKPAAGPPIPPPATVAGDSCCACGPNCKCRDEGKAVPPSVRPDAPAPPRHHGKHHDRDS